MQATEEFAFIAQDTHAANSAPAMHTGCNKIKIHIYLLVFEDGDQGAGMLLISINLIKQDARCQTQSCIIIFLGEPCVQNACTKFLFEM